MAGVIFALPLLVIAKVAVAHGNGNRMLLRFLDPNEGRGEDGRSRADPARRLRPRESPR